MGAPNPRPDMLILAIQGNELTIYAKLSELVPFVGTHTPSAQLQEAYEEATVKQHTRQRYPGGPTITVPAHTRRVKVSGKAVRKTLPGENAWMERTIGTGENAEKKVEQFTFTGAFADLKTWCIENAATDFVLRSPNGEPVVIGDATP